MAKETNAAEDFKAAGSAQKAVEKDLAAQSAENKSRGKDNEKLSLTEANSIEIIKGGKFLKKGTVLHNVSEKAVLVYRKKGLIK